MWEVVTFGKVPYPDLENSEVVDAVCDEGHRMSCPENCPKPLYVKEEIWNKDLQLTTNALSSFI